MRSLSSLFALANREGDQKLRFWWWVVLLLFFFNWIEEHYFFDILKVNRQYIPCDILSVICLLIRNGGGQFSSVLGLFFIMIKFIICRMIIIIFYSHKPNESENYPPPLPTATVPLPMLRTGRQAFANIQIFTSGEATGD